MVDAIYAIARAVGYTHPLHPPVTHLTVGLTLAALIFAVVATIRPSRELQTTVRHCLVLALLAWVPTVLLGVCDWYQFYQGAGLPAIRIKMGLAGLLPVLLIAGLSRNRRSLDRKTPPLLVLLLAALVVTGLGYFGGELVFGGPPAEPAVAGAADRGRDLFSAKCAFCHYPDRAEAKVGPGLKGVTRRTTLPTSGWAMTDANLIRQMRTPYKNMPAFDALSDADLAAVIAYLKTL